MSDVLQADESTSDRLLVNPTSRKKMTRRRENESLARRLLYTVRPDSLENRYDE